MEWLDIIYETLAATGWDPSDDLKVEIIPGVSALNSCASIVGSPLMTDFAVVSMSDLMVAMGNNSKTCRISCTRRFCTCNL